MRKHKGKLISVITVLVFALLTGCSGKSDYELITTSGTGPSEAAQSNPITEYRRPANYYYLLDAVEVNGGQGVCAEGSYFWVSGTRTLAKYDKNWKLVALNESPFKGYEREVNHIGDIDVYNNELYVGAEYFADGVGKNIQIAVYDGNTLELKRTFPFDTSSGQIECSGIAVDPDNSIVWMCSWAADESSNYLYKYDLESGEYLGRVLMQDPPKWIQGIACYNGNLFMSSDDGEADNDEPDHLYRTTVRRDDTECVVKLDRTFVDVIRQGEIEGLAFDRKNGHFLLHYNRGCRYIRGNYVGYYDGYDHEIKEIYIYNVRNA